MNKNINNPSISVIMAFYDCEEFIAQAIESVLNQTFSDLELILINDASIDGTTQALQKYLSDPRIIYINNERNLGKVSNMRAGLEKARSNIIAVMDGDDVCDITRFEKQYKFLADNPEISIVGTFMKIINESGDVIDYRTKLTQSEEISREAIVYCPFTHSSVMYRKDVVNSVGGYRHGSVSEDMDLFYRILYSGYKGANIPEYLFSYRYHKNNCLTRQHVWAALDNFKLRMSTIRKFKIKPTCFQWIMLYGQFFIGCVTTGPGRRTMEGFAKKFFYGSK